MRPLRLCRLLACAALLAAAQPATARAADDPFEPVNRRVHGFNQLVRARVLGPVAELYLSATPAGGALVCGAAIAGLLAIALGVRAGGGTRP